MAFENLVYYIVGTGAYEVLLPFVIIFAISFGVLDRMSIFKHENKKPNRKVNSIISLVLAFTTVSAHVLGKFPSGLDPIQIMFNSIGNGLVVLVAFLIVMLIGGLLGIKLPGGDQAGLFKSLMVVFSILVIGYAMFSSTYGWYMPFWIDSEVLNLVLILLVFGILISYITGDGSKPNPGNWEMFGKAFGGEKL